jgi:excisionase family DNA binding protein
MKYALTIEQAGQLLGLSRAASYRAVHNGAIPTIQIGRRMLVPAGKLAATLGVDVADLMASVDAYEVSA